MSGHTPGPWSACNHGVCSCSNVSAPGGPVAKVTRGEWGDDFPSVRVVGASLERRVEAFMDRIPYGEVPAQEARANALLISAAPEFYAAAVLEENAALHWERCDLCGRVSGSGPDRGCGVYVNLRRDARIQRQAAIAKAEGR